MVLSAEPYGTLKSTSIKGKSMAYIDQGDGLAIVFQHGNPTSSYLWRNILPYCEGLGRLIACDLIGMGASDKLDDTGPGSYTFFDHKNYLYALWDKLALGDEIVLVLHDWGSALGFNWAMENPTRVKAIIYMEAITGPFTWAGWPDDARQIFQKFRSDAGEAIVLDSNLFVEGVLPNAMLRTLTTQEMEHYRKPFARPGEDRRPTLSWPRQLPIDGQPVEIVEIVERYADWLARCDVPKLFINALPGAILTGEVREQCRTWANQSEITVRGKHFVQEDSPDEIGAAIADFIKGLDD